MNAIDATEHFEKQSDTLPPSLLVLILDTNPYPWSHLSPSLPLSKAVAQLLVFINGHLAFNSQNRVAVIASHVDRTAWLYPTPSDLHASDGTGKTGKQKPGTIENANKYRAFAVIEQEVLRNLRNLLESTSEAAVEESPTTTLMAGALTQALSYINKVSLTISSGGGTTSSSSSKAQGITDPTGSGSGRTKEAIPDLNARILIVSTSGDLAAQYIPVMNVIFAAQHGRIPIDILKLSGDTVLLQQASWTTGGIFLSPAERPAAGSPDGSSQPETAGVPSSLLPYLMQSHLPDTAARRHLLPSTNSQIDFRAACFCHTRVLDVGFVCSICLSIFCEEGVRDGILPAAHQNGVHGEVLHGARKQTAGVCLTCGSELSLRDLRGVKGLRQLLDDKKPKRRKKKNKREGDGDTPTPAG